MRWKIEEDIMSYTDEEFFKAIDDKNYDLVKKIYYEDGMPLGYTYVGPVRQCYYLASAISSLNKNNLKFWADFFGYKLQYTYEAEPLEEYADLERYYPFDFFFECCIYEYKKNPEKGFDFFLCIIEQIKKEKNETESELTFSHKYNKSHIDNLLNKNKNELREFYNKNTCLFCECE